MKNELDSDVYRSIVEQSIDAVVIINRSGDIVSWNPSAERLFGYRSEEVLGKYIHDILPTNEHRKKANESFKKFQHKGDGPLVGKMLQVRGVTKSGKEVHVQFSFSTVQVNGELYAFGFLRDISDLIHLQEKLISQSITDELTGIPNLRYYRERANTSFYLSSKNNEDLSLIMLDIDFFKKVNDQYGHQGGDIALQAFASNISQNIRAEDLFARVGGEEFVIALPKTPIEAAAAIAEELRAATEQLVIKTPDTTFQLTVSIGVASLHPGDSSLEDIQNRCDNALYQAKNTGRNRVVMA